MDPSFFVRSDELALRFNHPPGARRLSFANFNGGAEEWKEACRSQLIELLGLEKPPACKVQVLRETQAGHVTIQALVLEVNETLSIPAYLLFPPNDEWEHCVMAIHGHGEAEPCIGQRDDYHRQFALSLAQEGYLVLCPELRGFGPLRDLALHCDGQRLDYWTEQGHKAFSLATDSFQHGWPLLGQTVEDLLRWEDFLAREYAADSLSVAGISYGGDLALTYPVFSGRVERIFASGTFGSFAPIFADCYNAPAHCIPSVLQWIDQRESALGESFNAVAPYALSLVACCQSVAALFGRTAELEFVPLARMVEFVCKENYPTVETHCEHSPCSSIAKSQRLLGYQPRYTTEQIYAECIEYLLESEALKI